MEGYVGWYKGFRFHPTEEEIITHFLEWKMCGIKFPVHTIQDVVDVCKYEPWELPELSPMPIEDRVWYFFNAPVRCPNRKGITRTTNSGFWKSTGKDRSIWDKQGKKIGFKKNLVFHQGRAPGTRTNWVIHEYHSLKATFFPKEYVLFRLKRKSDAQPDNNTQIDDESLFDIDNYMVDDIDNLLAEVLQQETLYSDGCNKEHYSNLDQLMISFGQNRMSTDSNPTEPLSGVYAVSDLYAGDSSDTYPRSSGRGVAEIMTMTIPSSSDDDAFTEFDISSGDSNTDLPDFVCLERIVDEPSNSTRIYKANAQCTVPHIAVSSKVEVREAAEHAVDLPQRKNSPVKIRKDKQMVQATCGRTSSSSSSSSNRSDSINTKGSFIFMETPQLNHQTTPPSVYLFNVLVSLVLIIFIIWETMHLH